MTRTRLRRLLMFGMLGAAVGLLAPPPGWSQASRTPVVSQPAAPTVVSIEQPDAERTKEELSRLLERYPPSMRNVLALDPTLLGNQAYLAPYPSLVNFLNNHPEIARNPSFFIGEGFSPRHPPDRATVVADMWRDVLAGLAAFIGFGMAIGLIVWLVRTLIDYRRWNRLSKIQTDVHTKLLDRFATNNDVLAYIQSPAGSNFLQSSPIKLDAGPRSVAAPLGRILWSIQGGVVLIAGGIGLQVVSSRVADDASQPLSALGVLCLALGLGFVISAIISFVISQRLGLIETASSEPRPE